MSLQTGQARPISDLFLEEFVSLVRTIVREEGSVHPPVVFLVNSTSSQAAAVTPSLASTALLHSSVAAPKMTWSSPLLTAAVESNPTYTQLTLRHQNFRKYTLLFIMSRGQNTKLLLRISIVHYIPHFLIKDNKKSCLLQCKDKLNLC